MSNQPLKKLRDGLTSATIWENTVQTEDGEKTRLSISLLRSYKEGEDWKETSSFSPTELLKVSRLAERAYDEVLSIRQAQKDNA